MSKQRLPYIPNKDQNTFRHIQDNFATNDVVYNKDTKILKLSKTEPKLTELKDGDKDAFNDGSNVWRYYRIDGRLFKTQLTEV